MTFGSPFSKRAQIQSFSYRSYSIGGIELENARAKLNQIFEETPIDNAYDESFEETFSSVRRSSSNTNELRTFDVSKLNSDDRRLLKGNITLRWKRKQEGEEMEANKSSRETEDKQPFVQFPRISSTDRVKASSLQIRDDLDLFSSNTPGLESSSSSILEDASGSTSSLIEHSSSQRDQKKRQPLHTLNSNLNVTSNPCNCKRSQCLKLYCECFAAGSYCTSKCKCNGCKNNGEHALQVRTARERTLERNPRAFSPKISESTAAVTVSFSLLNISRVIVFC